MVAAKLLAGEAALASMLFSATATDPGRFEFTEDARGAERREGGSTSRRTARERNVARGLLSKSQLELRCLSLMRVLLIPRHPI